MLKLRNYKDHGDNEISIDYNKKLLPKLSGLSKFKFGKTTAYILSCKKEHDNLYIRYVKQGK